MKATTNQIKFIRRLLRITNLKEKQVLDEVTIQPVDCLDDATFKEADVIIGRLKSDEGKCQRMRRKLLAMGYEMNFDKPTTPAQNYMERKDVNFKNVNAWCLSSKSKHKKSMDKMTSKELEETVTQFALVAKSFYKQLRD